MPTKAARVRACALRRPRWQVLHTCTSQLNEKVWRGRAGQGVRGRGEAKGGGPGSGPGAGRLRRGRARAQSAHSPMITHRCTKKITLLCLGRRAGGREEGGSKGGQEGYVRGGGGHEWRATRLARGSLCSEAGVKATTHAPVLGSGEAHKALPSPLLRAVQASEEASPPPPLVPAAPTPANASGRGKVGG